MWCDFHFAKQGIHFRYRQDAARPNRSMAGHCRSDMVQPIAKGQGTAEFRQFGS
jgi:hypothetical protein